jgi:hypothetical protein
MSVLFKSCESIALLDMVRKLLKRLSTINKPQLTSFAHVATGQDYSKNFLTDVIMWAEYLQSGRSLPIP